jgi:DNA-binding MarR family transcriptional regulator
MTTSQILRTLEGRSLIARIPHPKDPRAKALRVAKSGQDLARRAISAVEGADGAFFAPIGADSGRLVGLFRLLAGFEG